MSKLTLSVWEVSKRGRLTADSVFFNVVVSDLFRFTKLPFSTLSEDSPGEVIWEATWEVKVNATCETALFVPLPDWTC